MLNAGKILSSTYGKYDQLCSAYALYNQICSKYAKYDQICLSYAVDNQICSKHAKHDQICSNYAKSDPGAQERLGVSLRRLDEMECLVSGCNFLLKAIRREAFHWDKEEPNYNTPASSVPLTLPPPSRNFFSASLYRL